MAAILSILIFSMTMLQFSFATLEGQRCGIVDPVDNRTSTCTLAYTKCNEKTKRCECDTTVAVSMKMPGFLDVTDCIPLEYVKATERCLPTKPDICSVLVPGAYCDTSSSKDKSALMKCKCQIGGVYPNCTTRVGSFCRTNETCSKDIPNSFCGDMVNGLGKCMCGELDHGKRYVASNFGDVCLPINCAAQPCQGDFFASTCVDLENSFECKCNNGTKGRSHSPAIQGICCSSDRIPCTDLKKCIPVDALCNGKSDCEDCSDEKHAYCMGPLPSDNLQCSSIQERDKTNKFSASASESSFVPSSSRQITATNAVLPPLFSSPLMSIPLGRGLGFGW